MFSCPSTAVQHAATTSCEDDSQHHRNQTMKPASLLLAILHFLACSESAAFVPINGFAPPVSKLRNPTSTPTPILLPTDARPHNQAPARLQMSIQALVGTTIQRPRIAALAAAFLLLAVKALRDPRAFFWPGARADKNSDADLPEGSMGCPFIGRNMMYMNTYVPVSSYNTAH